MRSADWREIQPVTQPGTQHLAEDGLCVKFVHSTQKHFSPPWIRDKLSTPRRKSRQHSEHQFQKKVTDHSDDEDDGVDDHDDHDKRLMVSSQ